MATRGNISWICCILFILPCNGFILEPSKGEPLRQLPRVGIFYSMWHSYAFQGQKTVTQNGGKLITIEDLIRSNHKLKMNDIYDKYKATSSNLFFYHTKPEAGFYCIYRKRPGESGHLPDCPDIESTLRRHAKQITEAGVDFVLADLTNLGIMSTQADVINYRPLEVLCEEWKKLRDQGIVTPDIAAWLPLSSGDNAWRTALSNVYTNSSYEDLILKHNGRKVIHGVASKALDPSIVSQLEANGITVVKNWANLPVSKYSKEGYWRMMSPCMGPKGQYSTSVVDADCSPVMTRNSPLGTMFPVTKTFQTRYASIPWQAAGTLSGLTFKKQMKAALAAQPDYLFVSGWNELIAQPQANPYTGKVDTYWSMGLENCVTKPTPFFANHPYPLWVDLYGEEFHRDFEPTIYNGDKYYKLLQSCIRVFRSEATTCSIKNEECCNMATSDIYINVFSMYNQGAHDSLLTTDPNERTILLRSGWREHCTYFNPGDSILCHDSHNRAESNTQFIIFKRPGHNRKALYRCYTGTIHFFSPDAKCEGYTTESLLGYVSTLITSETPRAFNRAQIDGLKRELASSERDFRSQIAANEKKAHENWLAARAAERELKEVRHDAGVLRQKLTELERRQMGPGGLIRPLPTRGLPPPGMMNGPPPPPGMERSPSRGSIPPPHLRDDEFRRSPHERLPPPPDRRPPPPGVRLPPHGPPEGRSPPPGGRMPPPMPEGRSPPPFDRRPPHPMDRRTPPYRPPHPDMMPSPRGPPPFNASSPPPRMPPPHGVDPRMGPRTSSPHVRPPPPGRDGRPPRQHSQV